MAGRRQKPQVNRRRYHEAQVAAARTPRAVLWAYCHWLVAAAWHAGGDRLTTTTDSVRRLVEELERDREEVRTR